MTSRPHVLISVIPRLGPRYAVPGLCLVILGLATPFGLAQGEADTEPTTIDLRFVDALGALYPGEEGERIGTSVRAEDLDGSGRDELILGVPFTKKGIGRVDIYYDPFISGVTDSVSAMHPDEATAPVRAQIHGTQDDEWFGFATCTGDLNDDGRPDLVVSSINFDYPSRPMAGNVYVFYGGNPALATTVATTRAADVVFVGAAKLDGIGTELATGDFDGDGRDDLVIAAPFGDTEFDKTYIERLYLYHGRTLAERVGDATSRVIIDLRTDADVVLRDVDYRELAGVNSGGLLVADYVGGDGIDDLVVGASRADGRDGWIYVFRGRPRSSGIYDAEEEADLIIRGRNSREYGSALAAGDFDNNGFLDLAIGARRGKGENDRSGTVTLLFANRIIDPTQTPVIFDLSEGEISPFFDEYLISGSRRNEYLGVSLASGDFNQDGVADLAAGANLGRTATNSDKRPGRVYVFAGRDRNAWGEEYDTRDDGQHLLIGGDRKEDEFGIAMTVGNFDDPVRPSLWVSVWLGDGLDAQVKKSGDLFMFGPEIGLNIDDHAFFPVPTAARGFGSTAHLLWYWAQSWGSPASRPPVGYDLDKSGQIDAGDLRVLKAWRNAGHETQPR